MADASDPSIPCPELAGMTVSDVCLHAPKTLGAGATVADARRALADDHVHLVLLTDHGRLLGTLTRADLPPSDDDAAAVAHAVLDGRTIRPDACAEEALRQLVARGGRRLAVVDDLGNLLGLLCLKRRQTGFCRDEDVAVRAVERASSESGRSGEEGPGSPCMPGSGAGPSSLLTG
ncbi:MAG: CBS domain-containing protein [Nocardioides sp.]